MILDKYSSAFVIICMVLYSCNPKKNETVFSYLNTSETNIHFKNVITENDSLNVASFQYIYNGGGVGIGDFNNDGFSDIVFTANQTPSKLFINEGNFKFQDVSEDANFITQSWVTGVSIIDINSDGFDDIYLSVGGAHCKNDCENLLFINQGINDEGLPTFKELAKDYKLNDGHYSQQAVFFDFDIDGDLDVFIAHNGNVTFDKNSPMPKRYVPKNLADYLLINESKEGIEHPVFRNVSDSLGITYKGFSLGVNIQDFNQDNLPDIYVSNDFITEDLLYINQGVNPETNQHKGFIESNKKILNHLTYNAMGVDIADINNDAYPDLLVLDMLPEDYKRQKRMLGTMNYDKYLLSKRNNYSSQFMHNTLQLHNGMLGDSILKTSEVGFISGMSSTDWSWAPILADFDNDGDKDTYITNGYLKDLTDLDFINYSLQSTIFGDETSRNKQLFELLQKLPGVKLPNYLYRNDGKLAFKDVSSVWKDTKASFSNGAAYADFDNDGDLDLVVNNLNQDAFVLKNNTDVSSGNSFLRVQLNGTKHNKKAIGAKVTLWQEGKSQHQFQSVVRGYLSSMEPIIHFGLSNTAVDSLQVLWPNGMISKIKDLKANTLVQVDINAAIKPNKKEKVQKVLLDDISSILNFKHKENRGHDYISQHLLVRQYSKFGPCIATGNIDNEIGDEIFIGGSKGEASSIWKQNQTGDFELYQKLDEEFEDTGAIFIDVDNDNDLDLYVASGGTEFQKNTAFWQDRIYINDGNGSFSKADNLLPEVKQISSCIKPNDYDNDGDIDIFIGSRVVAGRYPETPKSQLLKNTTNGFIKEHNEALINVGMVTDATWQDLNKDGWDDLIVVGEWMPITVFMNRNGTLEKTNISIVNKEGTPEETLGWWNTIEAADFDNDGDIDFIIGNQGENGFILPKENKPVYVYKKDWDQNGSIDPVIGQYFSDPTNNSTLFPVQSRDDIMKQLVKLKDKYINYEAFSKVSFTQLLSINKLDEATLKATTFASSYLENLGNGNYQITKLPERCQIAPVNDILVKDIDNDGYLDVLLVGNDKTSETNYGLNDALIGVYLKGNDNGFKILANETSGFYVPGQSHHITTLTSNTGEESIIASQNGEALKIFSINKSDNK